MKRARRAGRKVAFTVGLVVAGAFVALGGLALGVFALLSAITILG